MEAMRPFGISYYAAWIAADLSDVNPRVPMISNWPAAWAKSYIEENKHLYDPILIRAARGAGGFFWHELAASPSSRALELKRDANRLGMIDGFTVSWRSSLPTSTILSLSGKVLDWTHLECETASAIANGFISRTMCLRTQNLHHALPNLSPQERRLLHLAASGLSDNRISAELGIHRGTVLSHWTRIRLKLGASDRTQAVAIGIKSGQLAL
jgi:LuxR family quorum sensing-dependent transcriptional regulator